MKVLAECGRRAGVEIDTRTVEGLERLKDPLVKDPLVAITPES
jgi:hypothetical protein